MPGAGDAGRCAHPDRRADVARHGCIVDQSKDRDGSVILRRPPRCADRVRTRPRTVILTASFRKFWVVSDLGGWGHPPLCEACAPKRQFERFSLIIPAEGCMERLGFFLALFFFGLALEAQTLPAPTVAEAEGFNKKTESGLAELR